MSLPTKSPAEALSISPEALEVANCYLECQDINRVAELLDIKPDLVTEYLNKREVRAYIDRVFLDVGFNNRHTMRKLLDTLIEVKLREMDEAGISSTKDITEIIALSHKITMDLMDRQIKLQELENKRDTNIKNQTNIQINDSSSNYSKLMQGILKGEFVNNE